MLEKLKNTSPITIILYLLALILFVVWVLPKMGNYYSNVNKYEKSSQELRTIALEYDLPQGTQPFSGEAFKKDTELIFSKVDIEAHADNIYTAKIVMKKEDLKTFHTFIDSIALRYYVQLNDSIEYTTEAEVINVKMILKAL